MSRRIAVATRDLSSDTVQYQRDRALLEACRPEVVAEYDRAVKALSEARVRLAMERMRASQCQP